MWEDAEEYATRPPPAPSLRVPLPSAICNALCDALCMHYVYRYYTQPFLRFELDLPYSLVYPRGGADADAAGTLDFRCAEQHP